MAYQANLQNWMDMVESGHGQEDLAKLLDDDAVMIKPRGAHPSKGQDDHHGLSDGRIKDYWK